MTNNEREKHPPKHCPNCGSKHINYVECMAYFRGSICWDTYCDDCNWSGDVRPDSDLDYYRAEAIETHKWLEAS